ncbi:putative 3-hydroxyisobutyrate dehydrogenase [Magnetofaba australis IT-1]|uniref:Putative 3-hydroxyisobutyrate dehydrogenase n=1 Tax=Magnetofaba australis IT-1 TaxID=1434232 RepID=A0A1Y2K0L5_9PROT|nr:putative 3-hydroxyisobutyrate dehydrogenase [Magnetofaba australis IT-1]
MWNRSAQRSAPFQRDGITVSESPMALAQWADQVVIMVTDPAALLAVIDAPNGVAAGDLNGKTILNASTVSVEATQEAAKRVQAAGGRFLDVPVSGSKVPAETAQLVFLAGGEAADIDAARPLLDALGKTTVHCGAIGDGTRMKLAINLMLANLINGLCESLALTRKMGLPAQMFIDALNSGVMASPLLSMKGSALMARDFAPHFPLSLVAKDMDLIVEEARKQGAELPGAQAVRDAYAKAMERGLGDLDLAALMRSIEQDAGLESGAE